ncbi:hypothetical protein MUGA111182_02720 [Mucilaginibacter galii]|uniref:DUF4252 domain-containing protein n=1 Tax=Mucilaginibacter galii TaxID=2005073 RepID=A0A917J6Z4_9SPHI|nr:hypothetical protein [Mucilaginibacter galii]GGI50305.1 hypothetical protein GCM10011425_15170 [Mucilaginibacter galii]
MKNIILTISALLFSLYAFSQDTTSTQTAVFNLPKGSKKLSKQQYSDYSKSFKKRPDLLPNDHTYTKDGLLIIIRNRAIEYNIKTPLQKRKMQLDDGFKEAKLYVLQSSIENIDGMNYLIFEYKIDGDYRLNFYTDYVNDSYTIGIINYKSEDREKAHQYLDKLLKNLRFKRVANE